MPASGTPSLPIIVGTAGHIDHGKTSVVRRLTGVNTDRLPEEQARGISIDLGFADWRTPRFHFGLIDVPGHERFIKNMVAGATGIDLALLVVAADDGVMPQTREHLDILDLLGVRSGLIVMTKTDLVETPYQDLVEQELRELVAGRFLEGCLIVRVSTVTGSGFDQLEAALSAAATTLATDSTWTKRRTVFRMPIDQVFSKTGHGTVVTGTVLSGTVQKDDVIEVLPSGTRARVRDVQNHRTSGDISTAHRRTGINLAGIKREELHRGHELATPGYLRPSTRLLVKVRTLLDPAVGLKDRMTLRLHLGTLETSARLVLKGSHLEPGESAYAELRTTIPIVAEYGQRFILRRQSPPLTVAGGEILDPSVESGLRFKDFSIHCELRQSSDPMIRVAALLSQRVRQNLTSLEIACRTDLNPEDVPAVLADLKCNGTIRNVGTESSGCWVHADQWQHLLDSGQRAISRLLAEHQPRRNLPLPKLTTALRAVMSENLAGPIQAELLASGWLLRVGESYGPAEMQIKLSKRQDDLLRDLITRITAEGRAPPGLKELATATQQPEKKLEPLLQLAVDEGRLVQVAEGLYYDPRVLKQIRSIAMQLLADGSGATVAQLRDAWGITRRHAFPLCEWLNRTGATQRIGELHFVAPPLL